MDQVVATLLSELDGGAAAVVVMAIPTQSPLILQPMLLRFVLSTDMFHLTPSLQTLLVQTPKFMFEEVEGCSSSAIASETLMRGL